jgi:hypothetical protein
MDTKIRNPYGRIEVRTKKEWREDNEERIALKKKILQRKERAFCSKT